jgi:hypothetical protein
MDTRATVETTCEVVPRADASSRPVEVALSPTNLRSVPVAENLTHLHGKT